MNSGGGKATHACGNNRGLTDRERGETVELPLTIAALRYRCRAVSRASKGDSSQCSHSEPIARPERITWLASPPLANHVAVFVSCHALQTERPRWLVRTLNNLVLLLSMRAASAASDSAQHSTDSQCLAHTRDCS